MEEGKRPQVTTQIKITAAEFCHVHEFILNKLLFCREEVSI